MMNIVNLQHPFWRKEPITTAEQMLLNALLAAHDQAARRENASSVTLRVAFAGSGSYTSALAAALNALGGPHAPLVETYELLASEAPVMAATDILMRGGRVPGWGNSFIKRVPDPLFAEVADLLKEHWPEVNITLSGITDCLWRCEKLIFPNPSAWTAAAALVLGLPAELAPFLFVAGRLSAWTELLMTP